MGVGDSESWLVGDSALRVSGHVARDLGELLLIDFCCPTCPTCPAVKAERGEVQLCRSLLPFLPSALSNLSNLPILPCDGRFPYFDPTCLWQSRDVRET